MSQLSLVDFAEGCAVPIASLAATMTDNLVAFWLVLHALELAARDFTAPTMAPEAVEELERASRLAADRILAGWRAAETKLDFRAALAGATQKGGAA